MLALVLVGCANTSRSGLTVASDAIACPRADFAAFVPHSYNLDKAERVYRGCGRDVIVRCAQWQTEAYCQATYVSPPISK